MGTDYPFTYFPLIVKTGGHSDQLSRSVWGMDRYRLKGYCQVKPSHLQSANLLEKVNDSFIN